METASQMQAAGNSELAHPIWIVFFVLFYFLTLNKPMNYLRCRNKRDHKREKNVFENLLRLHIQFTY